ncbi:hypothetical protein LTR37_004465 [Vermiconidia calcicola]|uniref:Uncharacterized protein n=1 Tax=Vermiconidia calcicola TaxID=1690605 RepID=A0ACC3NM64_9PEZI|nr:hypothetical protein LTR37_004465 [Vermiconidia calcicola]
MASFKQIIAAAACFLGLASCQLSVDGTIAVLVRDAASSYSAYSGLEAYGIPYKLIEIPKEGVTLPQLNSSLTKGNYGGFILNSELAYEYPEGWHSALTEAQMQQIYAYQRDFHVRMVRLDAYPQPAFGVATAAADGTGCCGRDVEQLISFTNTSGFPTANLKANAAITHMNMWHYPARITDPATTFEIAKWAPAADGSFTSDTTAAVINYFENREQMVWFNSWATEWSVTSNFLQHSFIHWLTRGIFVGARKVYLSTQVDDVHLTTDLYSPAGTQFRIGPNDMIAHVPWQQSVNSRLPAGSSYVVELGHNGNGDIINATLTDPNPCSPEDAIYYDQPTTPPLEFQKPLGSGSNVWPTSPTRYSWTVACAQIDKLAAWFMNSVNRNAFMHVSHTFSHMNLNNATYSDASKEITFNQAWVQQMGLTSSRFSPKGLIPPAITGLHNGDVIRAWMTAGITRVVGDNSRPLLLNPTKKHWPLISTVAGNGYAGLAIIPRWSTAMFYNCDLPACTSLEWINTSGGWGNYQSLLDFERTTTSRQLLGLRHDAYMFHQANLRAADMPSVTIGSQTGKFSLLQQWVEIVVQEMTRITNWPMVTLKHDDLAQSFLDRQTRDQCTPSFTYTYSSDRASIVGVTVTATGNRCGVPVPVTFPGSATTTGTARSDKLGSEPLIMWTTLSGSAVSYTLSAPVRA